MNDSVKTSRQPRKKIQTEDIVKTESWERLTRLEFVVQQLVKDSERLDNRIDEIAKSQVRLTRMVQKTNTIIIAGFLSILFQAPELVTYIPSLIKILTATP